MLVEEELEISGMNLVEVLAVEEMDRPVLVMMELTALVVEVVEPEATPVLVVTVVTVS